MGSWLGRLGTFWRSHRKFPNRRLPLCQAPAQAPLNMSGFWIVSVGPVGPCLVVGGSELDGKRIAHTSGRCLVWVHCRDFIDSASILPSRPPTCGSGRFHAQLWPADAYDAANVTSRPKTCSRCSGFCPVPSCELTAERRLRFAMLAPGPCELVGTLGERRVASFPDSCPETLANSRILARFYRWTACVARPGYQAMPCSTRSASGSSSARLRVRAAGRGPRWPEPAMNVVSASIIAAHVFAIEPSRRSAQPSTTAPDAPWSSAKHASAPRSVLTNGFAMSPVLRVVRRRIPYASESSSTWTCCANVSSIPRLRIDAQ